MMMAEAVLPGIASVIILAPYGVEPAHRCGSLLTGRQILTVAGGQMDVSTDDFG
jgi:hypothetical protein